MVMQYPEQYYLFFERFNQGEYYECHDLLEEIWLEQKSNKFLQGLLQLAVGIYHFECGNIKGARWMFTSARNYLTRYLPVCWGLELDPIIAYINQCLEVLPPVDSVSLDEVKNLTFPYINLHITKRS